MREQDILHIILVETHLRYDYYKNLVSVLGESSFCFMFVGPRASYDPQINPEHCYCVLPNGGLYYSINQVIRQYGSGKRLLAISDIFVDTEIFHKYVTNIQQDDTTIAWVTPLVRMNTGLLESCGWGFSRALPKLLGNGMDVREFGTDSLISPVIDAAVFDLEKIEKFNLFSDRYIKAYGEIDLCLRASKKGYKCGVLPSVYIDRASLRDNLYREDLQTLYITRSFNAINELNNTNVDGGYQEHCFSQIEHSNDFIGSVLMFIQCDEDVSYYRMISKAKVLANLGWNVTIANSISKPLMDAADVIYIQYIPGFMDATFDDYIFSNRKMRDKVIVDLAEVHYNLPPGHPLSLSHMKFLDKATTYKIPIIAPDAIDNNIPVAFVNSGIEFEPSPLICNPSRDNLIIGVYGSDTSEINCNKLVSNNPGASIAIIGNGIYKNHIPNVSYIGYNRSHDYPHISRMKAIASSGITVGIAHLSGMWYDIIRIHEMMYMGIPVIVVGDTSRYNWKPLEYCYNGDPHSISIQDMLPTMREMLAQGRKIMCDEGLVTNNVHKWHNLFLSRKMASDTDKR